MGSSVARVAAVVKRQVVAVVVVWWHGMAGRCVLCYAIRARQVAGAGGGMQPMSREWSQAGVAETSRQKSSSRRVHMCSRKGDREKGQEKRSWGSVFVERWENRRETRLTLAYT